MSRFMDGVSGVVVTNVGVSQASVYPATCEDHSWAKLSKERQLNSTTMDLIAQKLDVRDSDSFSTVTTIFMCIFH